MIATSAPHWHPALRRTTTLGEALALVFGAGVAAGAVLYLGFWSLAVAAYFVGIVWALLAPRGFTLFLLLTLTVLEPNAIDFTGPMGDVLWEFPPVVERALPLTITPFDMLLLTAAFSLAMRPGLALRPAPGLPGLVWFVPVVMMLGYAYGVFYKGGPSNIAYIELRGLLIGGVALFVASRMLTIPTRWLHVTIFTGTIALSVIVIARYLMFVRGDPTVSTQFFFEHSDALLLGFGGVYGIVLFLRAGNASQRVLLIAYEALILSATAATGRRSGTLVMLIALLVIVALLMTRRPMITVWFASALFVAGGLYIGAYWDQEFGAAAQPARAIRSQFDPSLNDSSSNTYREFERFNVVQTLRVTNPIFGVGLGNSFGQFIPLPSLPWWPFQFITPHDNILWIWLKMGIVGVGVLLGVWVIALRRCLTAFRRAARDGPTPTLPLAVAASLVMFFAFAQVDVMLVAPRSTVPLGILLAVAFSLPNAVGPDRRSPTPPTAAL